jgi:hypothetical protein
MITVQIATLPDRETMLWQTVKSLYQQADAFYIMLNGHKEEPRIPDPSDKIRYVKLQNERKDGAKFYEAEYRKGYVFTMDDDLTVKDGYISLLKSKVDKYQGAVSLHGKIYNRPPVDFRRAKTVYRCLGTVEKDTRIDLIGTGCMAYHTDLIKVKYDDFPIGGLADVWFSKLCWEQSISMWVIAHQSGYLQYLYPSMTLWQTMGRATLQTELIKSFIK